MDCKMCSRTNVRTVQPTNIDRATGIDFSISKIQETFCPPCEKKFEKWLTDKGYSESGCWCAHIQEYIDGS